MAELLSVPEVIAGVAEVQLSEWLVPAGATVRAGDPIATVETDKALVEIEAESDGVLLRTLVESGASVAVGAPLAVVGSSDEVGSDPGSLLAGLRVSSDGPGEPVPATSPAPPLAAPDVVSPSSMAANGRLFVSPIARRMLREAGLDAQGVIGTGPNGRISRRDAEQAIARSTEPARVDPVVPAAASAPAAARPARDDIQEPGFTDEPHSRLRRAIATRLSASKTQVPHFYLKRTAVLDRLLTLRTEINAETSVRISVNDLIVRAVGVAYTEVPEANVIWTSEALRRYRAVDVGVAIASEQGLVTPVVRSVESSTVSAVSRQVKQFIEQASTGRLAQRDLEGGTICVTNLGMYDVEEFAAIINPPQSAILAVGAVRPNSVVVEEAGELRLELRRTVRLVLSVDHRAIDGALAARWFDALIKVLESPLRLLC